ncbi:MAG: SdrD B-like domain-containing protein [Planctomycetota bacterium]
MRQKKLVQAVSTWFIDRLEPRKLLAGFQPNVDGVIAIDAELYDDILPGTDDYLGSDWTLDPTGGDDGGSIMFVPDAGRNADTVNKAADSPRLDYVIDFDTAGVHYVWLRAEAPTGGDNSAHIGLNGTIPTTGEHAWVTHDAGFLWNGTLDSGSRVRIDVPTAGEHTLNLFMREDGLLVDRLVVTPDASYTPTGFGPVTSSRDVGTGSISGTVWADLDADGFRDLGEPDLRGVTVYLDANGNAALDWSDDDGDGEWSDGEGERWHRTDVTGTYAFTGLSSGDYSVRQITPLPARQTSPIEVLAPTAPVLVEPDASVPISSFGREIAISGDTMIVSSGHSSGQTEDAPAALVYRLRNGSWVEEAELFLPVRGGPIPIYSVAIDGDVAVIGDELGGNDFVGLAHVFVRDAGNWSLAATLEAPDPSPLASFGSAVAVHQDRIAISARKAGSTQFPEATPGAVYLFQRSGDAWSFEQKVGTSYDGGSAEAIAGSWFGFAIALEGNRLIVGGTAPSEIGGGSSATIFHRIQGNWSREAQFHISAEESGISPAVALKGDRAVLGSVLTREAEIYEFGFDGWARVATLTDDSDAVSGHFGVSVALGEDRVLVGSPDNYYPGHNPGAAYLFERWVDGSWQLARELHPDRDIGWNRFGYAVAIEGDVLAVGSFNDPRVHTFGVGDRIVGHSVTLAAGEARGDLDFGIEGLPGLDLAAMSDTGRYFDDDVTRLNNVSPDSALTLMVNGTTMGDKVQLLARPAGSSQPLMIIGQAVAISDATAVTTDGSSTLADGTWDIFASIEKVDGSFMPVIPLAITIDTVAPAVTTGSLTTPDPLPTLTGTVELGNEPTVTVQLAGVEETVVLAPTTNVWSTSAGDFGPLAPGDYEITATATDIAGNSMLASPATLTILETGIYGTLWIDLDGNGSRDSGEPGRAGVGVFLDADFDGVLDDGEAIATTDAEGRYVFTDLPVGEYDVLVVPPTGYEAVARPNQPWATTVASQPLADFTDAVFSVDGRTVYASWTDGIIKVLDAETGEFLPNLTVGADPTGLDTTPDGRYLFVGEGITYDGVGKVRRVDLETREIVEFDYVLNSQERGVHDLKVGSDGNVYFTTEFSGSGWTSFRRLDPATGEMTVLRSVRERTGIARNAGRDTMFLAEGNISSGPLLVFDVATGTFPATRSSYTSYNGRPLAVSPGGDQFVSPIVSVPRLYNDDLSTYTYLYYGGEGNVFDPVRPLFYTFHGSSYDDVYVFDTDSKTRTTRYVSGPTTAGTGVATDITASGSRLLFAFDNELRLVTNGTRPATVWFDGIQSVSGVDLGITRGEITFGLTDDSVTGDSTGPEIYTSRNNADADSRLAAEVVGTAVGDVVELWARPYPGESGNILLGTAVAGAGTTTVVSDGANALSDGFYTFEVVARDEYGTLSSSNDLLIGIDTVAPDATFSPFVTADTTPSLTGTISEIGSLNVDVNGISIGGTGPGSSTSWVVTVPAAAALSVGPQIVTVTAVDLAGNTSVIEFADALVIAPKPAFSISDANALEGDDGTTQMTFTITADRPLVDAGTIFLNISAVIDPQPGDATTDDWGNAPASLSWQAGDEPTFTFSVDVVGDDFIEPDESFRILLGDGGAETFTIADGEGVGTIVNDDLDPMTGVISGTRYHDLDQDGTRDSGEPGLAGRRVFIDLDADGIYDDGEVSVTTDVSGFYQFDGLALGIYRVVAEAPADGGWAATDPADRTRVVTLSQIVDSTLDFEDLAHSSSTITISTYEKDGYTLGSTSDNGLYSGTFTVFGPTSDRWAGSWGVMDNVSPRHAYIERDDGMPFDLLGLDVARWSSGWIAPVQIIGTRQDGSTVTQTLPSPSAVAFESFDTPNLTDVVRLDWNDSGSYGYSHQLDDIRLRTSGLSEVADADFGEWQTPAFEVIRTTPDDDGVINAFTSYVEIYYNNDVDVSTLEAADATFNGVLAAGVTTSSWSDRYVRFTLPELVDGPVDFSVAAGALVDEYGQPTPAIDLSLTRDTVAPQVIGSSIQSGDVLYAEDEPTWEVQFSEAISGKPRLFYFSREGQFTPRGYIEATNYNDDGTDFLSFDIDLPEGAWTFSLQEYQFVDLAGNRLSGGDYEVAVSIDRRDDQPLDIQPVGPLGSLVYSAASEGYLHELDSDTFTLHAAQGQPVRLVFTPFDDEARLTVSGTGGYVESFVAGEPIIVDTAGTSGMNWSVWSDTPTRFTVDVIMHAVSESPDATAAQPVPLDTSAWQVAEPNDFEATRYAARGTLDFNDIDEMLVDQSQLSDSGGLNFGGYSVFGQTFVPDSDIIDAIDLVLDNQVNPTSVRVSLYEYSGIAANPSQLLATSDEVMATENHAWNRFVFDGGVAVIPGATYMFDIEVTSGDTGLLVSSYQSLTGSGSYPRGGRVLNSTVSSTVDLAFRIGTLRDAADGDVWSLDLTPHVGESIDLVLDGASPDATLQLFAPDGSLLATADATADSFDLGLLGFIVPAAGVYTVRVDDLAEGEYTLVATAALGFEAEADDAGTPTQLLDGQAVLGHIEPTLVADPFQPARLFGVVEAAPGTPWNYPPLALHELDPLTGQSIRLIASDQQVQALAVSGSTAYAIDPQYGGVGSSIQAIDVETGQAAEPVPFLFDGFVSGAGMYGDLLVLPVVWNGSLAFIDPATGDGVRTLDSAYPSEAAGDVAGAVDRGSLFVGQFRTIWETDAETGVVLNTFDLTDELADFGGIAGLAYLDGRLLVMAGASAATAPALFEIDPDTGDVSLVASGGNVADYTDLGGSKPLVAIDVPMLGSPGVEGGDRYGVTLQAGETLNLDVRPTRWQVDAGREYDLAAVLVDPNGIVVYNTPYGLGGAGIVSYEAVESGDYTVQILARGGEGEYVLTSDVQPPTSVEVVAAAFDFGATPSVGFTFDADVSGGLSVGDLRVENLTTGQSMLPGEFDLDWDASTLTATFSANVPMSDGDYRFTLSSDVSDGTATLGSDVVLEDFLLRGDINHDRRVDLADFGILRANFGSGGLFAQGDLDGDGTVNLSDFGILRATFGNRLDPADDSLFA